MLGRVSHRFSWIPCSSHLVCASELAAELHHRLEASDEKDVRRHNPHIPPNIGRTTMHPSKDTLRLLLETILLIFASLNPTPHTPWSFPPPKAQQQPRPPSPPRCHQHSSPAPPRCSSWWRQPPSWLATRYRRWTQTRQPRWGRWEQKWRRARKRPRACWRGTGSRSRRRWFAGRRTRSGAGRRGSC